jgi:hypothetical protein
MRRAWMTGLRQRPLAGRDTIEQVDLPGGGPRRPPLGFMQ